ncbi:MAG: hypothetical protein ACREJ3_17375, partial [Polyangiaceae bacterium]
MTSIEAYSPRPPAPGASSAPVRPASFQRLDTFDASSACTIIGEQLRLVRAEAARFRTVFAATGTPEYVDTFDLARVPYPTEFGFFRVSGQPSPYLTFTNRLIVVRWRERTGARRTLLWEPSDVGLGGNVPFYADLTRRTPKWLLDIVYKHVSDPIDHVRQLGIDPAEVDFIAFDHLHTQDCRRLLGTNGPAADLSPSAPVAPMFPNAKLIVQRAEWELVRNMHPWQSRWYQPKTYDDLRDGTVLPIEGDVLIGPGVGFLSTPGHSTGMMSLVLNTSTGIWASSENVIAAELLTPERSEIPGVRRAAEEWGLEVIVNGNTIENVAAQYNSA